MEFDIVHRTSLLVFQLSAILFAAWFGGEMFKKWKLPSVLGEIVAGTIIGPYCLGRIGFVGFHEGLFPLAEHFPVSIELYSLATIASIILLFLVGLETDLRTFIRFSFAGLVVGTFGVIVSFVAGDFVGIIFSKYVLGKQYGCFDSIPMFLGVISTATSVGISARILSEKKKMNAPEGVTILSAAVIDDVLGIVALAVTMGIAKEHSFSFSKVFSISLKAVGMGLFFAIVGLYFSPRLSALLKRLKDHTTIAMICFSFALLLAGVFEKSGLAMIIGAYITGLSFSKTDLSFIIQEKFETLQRLFVPIFFCVMGMLINVNQLFSGPILIFGGIYIVLAVLSKLIGCGIPALFLNFNTRGALRIGMGMVPRGEVALIIAGIGLSSGIIGDQVFNLAIIMTFVTTLVTPTLLDKLLESDKPVLRKEFSLADAEEKHICYLMPNMETTELFISKIIQEFENEGYFVHCMILPDRLYHIRKEDSFITMTYDEERISFDCLLRDETFIHTLFYEVIAELEVLIKNLQNYADKATIGRNILDVKNLDEAEKDSANPLQVITRTSVKARLVAGDKQKVLKELVGILVQSGHLDINKQVEVMNSLTDRESTVSTGMQDGIAFPHAKTMAVDKLMVSVGVKKEGIDFASFDGKPSTIFILTLVPKDHPQPYLQYISRVSKFLAYEENRQLILDCNSNIELFSVLSKHL